MADVKLHWQVAPSPTGRYRSFDKRGWPTAYYGKGDKWQESTEPLTRYLAAQKKRGYDYRSGGEEDTDEEGELLEIGIDDDLDANNNSSSNNSSNSNSNNKVYLISNLFLGEDRAEGVLEEVAAAQ